MEKEKDNPRPQGWRNLSLHEVMRNRPSFWYVLVTSMPQYATKINIINLYKA